jgi:uncharacterized Tic20 family protein
MELSSSEKQIAMFCHLISFSGFIIPLASILGPLVLWLLKKDESKFIDEHGKESVNFQISLLIYGIISGILVFVLIGILGLIAIVILWLVFTIIASLKASNGETYRYPLTIRFVK